MTEKFAYFNGIIISPEKANKEDNFLCPKCKNKVILCDGEYRRYFRHLDMQECNFYGNESDIHFNAKLKLKDILLNNQLVIYRKCCNCDNICDYHNPKFKEVKLEYHFADDNRSADLAAFITNKSSTHSTIFEIFKTHKTSELDRPEPWFDLSADEIMDYSNGKIRCYRKKFCDDCINKNTIGTGIIYANQRGAGCGKTYESIQLLTSYAFPTKNIFIYMTKMHTAKDVILNELQEQYREDKLFDIVIHERINDKIKQYVIRFTRKDGREILVIIGTIDSFLYALVDKTKLSKDNGDYFENIRQTIIDRKLNITNDLIIKYAGEDIPLRNNTLLILDEAQDLPVNYIHTLDAIIQNTSTDLYMIGDKLQSIWFKDNIYSYIFSENCNLRSRLERDIGENIIRRFHNKTHQEFVNRIVRFSHYGMREIADICCEKYCKISHISSGIDTFCVKPIFGSDDDINVIEECIDNIILKINQHQDMNPEDFMIIFPTISTNPIAARLEDRLNEYWAARFNSPSIGYTRYAFLHKSQDGQPINTKDSEGMTRLVSIHASKGNGAKVVFLIGINEYVLKLFSGGEENIIYESLLHVALTRHKQYLYLGIQCDSSDDINRRIAKSGLAIELKIGSLSGFMKYNKISQWINEKTFADYLDPLIHPNEHLLENLKEINNGIIEWNYHIIRYCSLLLNFKLKILRDFPIKKDDDIRELSLYSHPIYQGIKSLGCKTFESVNYKDYTRILKDINKLSREGRYDEMRYIPILKHENITFTDRLMTIINKIKEKAFIATHNREECINKNIDLYGNNIDKLPQNHREQISLFRELAFCPLESVIIIVLSDIIKRGIYSSYTFTEIYHLIFAFTESYKHNSKAKHSNEFLCKCDSIFSVDKILSNESKYSNLYNHNMDIRRVNRIYGNYRGLREISRIKNKLRYNGPITHSIYNDSITLSSQDELIATYDNILILFTFKPEVNKLCFNELLLNCMIKKFLYQQYGNENLRAEIIIQYIITLSNETPLRVVIDSAKLDEQLKRDIKDCIFSELSRKHNSIFEIFQLHRERSPHRNDAIYTILREIEDNSRVTFPKYIKSFFEELKSISSSKISYMEIILAELLNKNSFIKRLDEMLMYSINNLLGL